MTATFYLASEAKTLNTGERPIIVAVHLKGVRVLTNIGFAIDPDSWNEKTGFVKKGVRFPEGNTTDNNGYA